MSVYGKYVIKMAVVANFAKCRPDKDDCDDISDTKKSCESEESEEFYEVSPSNEIRKQHLLHTQREIVNQMYHCRRHRHRHFYHRRRRNKSP